LIFASQDKYKFDKKTSKPVQTKAFFIAGRKWKDLCSAESSHSNKTERTKS